MWSLHMFNPDTRHKTIYTQYKRDNSNLCDIVDRAHLGLNERHDFNEFYENFWDIETATGQWLDIWGVIVAVDRYLSVEQDDYFFGYEEGDRQPFNSGIFYTGENLGTNVFRLNDDVFRRVIIAKAMANIAACDTESLNKILTFFFKDRGKTYVTRIGNMAMNFVFEFELEAWEKALLKRGDIFPRPAGVLVNNIVILPEGLFGFNEGFDYDTFNNGTYYTGQ